jgi:hypothetical protein
MPVKTENSTRFMDEVHIISPVAFVLAIVPYVVVLAAIVFATLSGKKPPMPLPAMIAVGTLGGTVMACYVLLIGYVNSDAGRRGMSRLGWTLLAIFIPNALGIVLYFVLRKPLIATCPQCGGPLEPGFGFCPRCRHHLNPTCPKCQRSIHAGDKFCPYCGADLGSSANEVVG